MGTNWTEQQLDVIKNRGGTLLVSAAAGSGKTAVLVERVLRYITDEDCPRDIDSFLIVTFTRAAASEMRGKIASALSKQAAENPTAHIRRQLLLVHRAQITTVHAFCMSLIKEHYNELGLPPDFGMADEGQISAIQNEVLDDVLESRYDEADSGFELLAEVMGAGRDDKKLRKVILETFDTLQSSPNPNKVLESYKNRFLQPFDRFVDTDWGGQLRDTAVQKIKYGMSLLQAAIDEMQTAPDVREKYEEAYQSDMNEAEILLAMLEDGAWDASCEQCEHLCAKRARLKAVKNYEDKDFLDSIKRLREEWKKISCEIKDKLLCLRENEIAEDKQMMAPAVSALCDVVQRFSEEFAKEKRRRNLLDFNDLEHFALKLLVQEDGSPTQLADEMHFTEIMVDEYQDTNAVQDSIFRALSDDEKNIFMVGDVKQSIYRFRQANPDIFLQKYKRFRDAEGVFDNSPRRIVLSKNFRSRAEVLKSVNTLFENVMSEQLGDIEYTDKEALYTGAEYPQSEQDYKTEFCLIETGSDEEDAPERTQLEADYAAQRIRNMLDSGFLVTDKQTGKLRKCRPEDFVILMRSLSMKLPIYQKALMRYSISASGDEQEDILQTPEVLTMLSMLETLDNPHQDLPLIASLSSPMFGFSEQELAQIRLADTEGDFYTALRKSAETNEKARKFCESLDKWRNLASDMTVHRLLWSLIEQTGAMEIYGTQAGGKERQRNLNILLEYAAGFEGGYSRGLFAFVQRIREMREQDKGIRSSAGAENPDSVRIMTIHKSKGLEFPIVILADCSKKFNETDLTRPVLLSERLGIAMKCRDTQRGLEYDGADRLALAAGLRQENISEELRVLYVAMTRAKEKLIITASFENAEKAVHKWESLSLASPLYAMQSAKQYSSWIGATLLKHPAMGALRRMCVIPPEICLKDDDSWQVKVLPYTQLGQAIEEDKIKQQSEERCEPLPELKPYNQEALANLPSKLTATSIASESFKAEETRENTQTRVKTKIRRPCFVKSERPLTASEIGTAHHLFLQFCDFEKCMTDEGIEFELRRMKDRHILSAEQANAVSVKSISRFFHSELFERMKGSNSLRREFKFSVLVPASDYFEEAKDMPDENVLLQGVVDCMFETPEGITVVDFKTDRVKKGGEYKRAEQYRPQLEAYAKAVQLVFNKKVCRCCLYFLNTGKTADIQLDKTDYRSE